MERTNRFMGKEFAVVVGLVGLVGLVCAVWCY